MADHNKTAPRPLFQRGCDWDSLRHSSPPKRPIDQDIGLPSFVEPTDVTWIDWARRRLSAYSLPGYVLAPLCSPSTTQTAGAPSPRSHVSEGLREIRTGQGSWRISLDVSQFSPEDIAIKTKEGYLEIAGKHEERQDENGKVSRRFSRKYKLPPAVDRQHIRTSMSPDGILSVETLLPASASTLPAEVAIPVQMQTEQ
ncbi:heat shock protein beta-1-like [Denticeps clupeoides]|uniref:SHSP domain-containing protein n=1 Tax=Denticeps clupeoides TaxID=299321 RepID=A0AAY4BA87_9TELE|nr:heat shock protein beta-1-like [Denticeps clupeoides]